MSKASSQPLLVNVSPGAGLPQYQPHPGPAPYYQTVPLTVRIEVEPYRYRRSPLRRFLCAFIIAVGIYAVIKAVVGHHRHHGFRMPWEDHWDTPSDLAFEHCVSGISSGSALAESSSIPLDAETVLLVSRYRSSSWGSSISGSLDITTSARLNNTAKIVIHSLHNTDITACMVRGNDGETGVAVFSKGSWLGHGRDAKFVKINLVLPRPEKPLQLKGIVAQLPNFSLNIGNLTGAVDFKSATFKTSNAAVRVESLTAGHAKLHTSNALITAHSFISADLDLKTSNGGISGAFNTSGSLVMTTSNAPISVTVGLENSNKTRPHDAPHAHQQQCTSPPTRTKAATSASPALPPTVDSTSKSPPPPVDSALNLMARTSNAAAEVHLHPAYQGFFRVSTSAHFVPSVTQVDESGEDKRQIEYSAVRGREVHGYVYLKEKNKELGRVVLSTSNAPAELFV
ncbi:hypothetical protein MVEN_01171400 [Mycena venus]|uniref:Adhesin domain-containing protein n=1 Tax=Mycena venus TaxID=2733690 RepID=A0A8H6Y528_9AGAR|nr:hypothetical protein MVEN_01171400 [Mycena venus]